MPFLPKTAATDFPLREYTTVLFYALSKMYCCLQQLLTGPFLCPEQDIAL